LPGPQKIYHFKYKGGKRMNLSSMMGVQAQQMHQTLNTSLLKSALSTQAAQSIVMLDKFNASAESTTSPNQAPHPSAGKNIDLKI